MLTFCKNKRINLQAGLETFVLYLKRYSSDETTECMCDVL